MALNIICPKCKAEISSLSTVCPSCQAPVNADSAVLSPEAVRSPTQVPSFFSVFFSILAEPRAVFEGVLKRSNGEYTWAMLLVTGILVFLEDLAKGKGSLLYLLIIPVVMGGGWLVIWVIAWIYYHVGRWLGGKGTLADLFDQVIWAGAVRNLASIAGILGSLGAAEAWRSLWKVVGWGLDIWGVIFTLILLSVAHRYSFWKALGTLVICTVIFLIPLTVLMSVGNITWTQVIHDILR